MSCIKNGAKIYFENYGMLVVGDVYFLGDCFIFRWNPLSKQFLPACPEIVTHYIDTIINSESWWHRDDLGVTVVPAYLVSAWER